MTSLPFDPGQTFFLIAGPCVLESEALGEEIARHCGAVAQQLGVAYVFKASFDKANRTSIDSYRGPGLREGLRQLASIKDRVRCPVLSDIHEPEQAEPAADVLDIIQIPAFLCRQTDLVQAAARTGKPLNLKKGQFMAPDDMRAVAEKAAAAGAGQILLTERGTTFGYHDLVVDYRSIPRMRALGYPVVFDATHSVQQPGGLGTSSGGAPEYIDTLAVAAVAAGCDGLFLEVHPQPSKARSDAASMLPLDRLEALLKRCLAVRRAVAQTP